MLKFNDNTTKIIVAIISGIFLVVSSVSSYIIGQSNANQSSDLKYDQLYLQYQDLDKKYNDSLKVNRDHVEAIKKEIEIKDEGYRSKYPNDSLEMIETLYKVWIASQDYYYIDIQTAFFERYQALIDINTFMIWDLDVITLLHNMQMDLYERISIQETTLQDNYTTQKFNDFSAKKDMAKYNTWGFYWNEAVTNEYSLNSMNKHITEIFDKMNKNLKINK